MKKISDVVFMPEVGEKKIGNVLNQLEESGAKDITKQTGYVGDEYSQYAFGYDEDVKDDILDVLIKNEGLVETTAMVDNLYKKKKGLKKWYSVVKFYGKSFNEIQQGRTVGGSHIR